MDEEQNELENHHEDCKPSLATRVSQQIKDKGPFDLDSDETRKIKSLIRRGEARAALFTCGVHRDRIKFLDLPFYEKGRYRRFFLDEDDVNKLQDTLQDYKPDQIFVTGSECDPSSIEYLCFDTLQRSLQGLKNSDWVNACSLWLYRCQGEDWESHKIDMAVPLSPDELANKLQAIYQHQSQRGQSAHSATLKREAWQEAEAQNRKLAELYDRLGLAEYEALEAFRRWKR